MKTELNELVVGLGWNGEQDVDLDISAIMLEKDGKLNSSSDLIFYGNLKHSSGCLKHTGDKSKGNGDNDAEQIIVAPNLIPDYIQRIIFVVTVYDEEGNTNFNDVKDAYIRITDQVEEPTRYNLGEKFPDVSAAVVCEMFKNTDSKWEYSINGKAYPAGVISLFSDYGLDVSEEKQKDAEAYKKTLHSAPPEVELSVGQHLILKKPSANAENSIIVNLNWNNGVDNASLKGNETVDLDLACLYELKNGERGVVQALGNSFGSLVKPPFIELDGDDKTGESYYGETISISNAHLDDIKRILIFVSIYDGAENWQDVNGVVTIVCAENPKITINMDEYDKGSKLCAVALVENDNANMLSMEKVVEFFDTRNEMAKAFEWNVVLNDGTK
ncbi:MAG: TerD domain-containing protein [Selenomonadaceae bacterium]|nr:TerD domain-containing protein [Selenomonadaceae bacterium]